MYFDGSTRVAAPYWLYYALYILSSMYNFSAPL
jgi:hypothetical protein